MESSAIENAIYEKYITPTKASRPDFIGVEVEMPVVDLSGRPVEESVSIETAAAFAEKFGFEEAGRDADGNINSMIDKKTGDDLSFDCSYSNLELSMGRCSDLFEIKRRFTEYYKFLNGQFAKSGYTLTGMGVNPNANINHNKPIPNERYRMLYHYLHSYPRHRTEVDMRFHDRPDFGTFTSASQVQLDVSCDRLTDVLNVFGMLEPYKSILFANSYLPDYPEYLCVRNMLWEHSMQGYNPHNIGMFDQQVGNIDELVQYIGTQSIYCTMREGRYVDFTPVPVREYFARESIEGEYFDGERYRIITIRPEAGDLEYLRTFKFEDLTYRGTIEYRSSCCQPIKDVMTVAAFHTGLNKQLYELKELVTADRVIYGHGYSPAELQRLLSLRKLPEFLDRKALSRQLVNILDLASSGLKLRGKGEETLLVPLYDRAERLINPASAMLEGLERGVPMEHFIGEYAAI
ncbi:glutamate-cysteine ligase family protein [Ruminococcus sp.]|uniref:glutamate-cysteine ligase family protein n=1 Tax=Ruminococcus sp. TaxID=41978 RepID=UPI0025D06675|nr:glutamate-cysteine ligase family protein [Ruminococcus sp.]MBQ8967480.1 glutamylcysteine synthetase [Ruminococcus sp.]